MQERRPDDATDEILASCAQAGDREAFGLLVRRHREAILRLCLGAADDYADAEDLCHDAFVEAFVKLHQLREPAKFLPWLKALTLNLCRTAARRRRNADQAWLRTPEWTSQDDEQPREQVVWAYSHLSDDHRLALALRYSEGLAYQEMADFLGVPIGTVMSRLSRARHALRRQMAGKRYDQEHAMAREDRFVQDVDAEVDTLIEMFRESDEPMEWLSVILDRSPGRFRELLA